MDSRAKRSTASRANTSIPDPDRHRGQPNLDPAHLRLGERILIRKKEIGSEDEAGAKEQWEAYRNTLNSVAEEGYAYHMVKPGETFYSLSRRFGITEEQLGSLNGGLKPADLKAGSDHQGSGFSRRAGRRGAGSLPTPCARTPSPTSPPTTG